MHISINNAHWYYLCVLTIIMCININNVFTIVIIGFDNRYLQWKETKILRQYSIGSSLINWLLLQIPLLITVHSISSSNELKKKKTNMINAGYKIRNDETRGKQDVYVISRNLVATFVSKLFLAEPISRTCPGWLY